VSNDERSSLVYDSGAHRIPFLDELRELVRYRFLLWNLISRDLKVRYKRSFLGFFWAMVNPLLTMIVLLLVFTNLFRFEIENYAIYILSGLLVWQLFTRGTAIAIRSLLDNSVIFKEIYVPPGIFVAASIGGAMVNFLFSLIPLLALTWIMGIPPSPSWLFLPIPIILTALFSLGFGLVVAALAVFFTDVLDIYEVGTNAYFYLTPILYPISILQEPLAGLEQLNPMYHLIRIFRMPLIDGVLPSIGQMSVAALFALAAAGIGWFLFTRLSVQFAYRT
jgi:ABC-2 type transport system permease protein